MGSCTELQLNACTHHRADRCTNCVCIYAGQWLTAGQSAVPACSHRMRPCRAGHTEGPKQDKHIPADPNSARSRKLAAKKAIAKEVRSAKKQAAKARKQRATERGQQQTGKSSSFDGYPHDEYPYVRTKACLLTRLPSKPLHSQASCLQMPALRTGSSKSMTVQHAG